MMDDAVPNRNLLVLKFRYPNRKVGYWMLLPNFQFNKGRGNLHLNNRLQICNKKYSAQCSHKCETEGVVKDSVQRLHKCKTEGVAKSKINFKEI